MSASRIRCAALLALIAGTGHSLAAEPLAESRHLSIASEQIDTTLARPDLVRSLRLRGTATRMVIQLDGPITHQRRQRLEAAGVALGDYLPSHAYIADLSKADPAAVARLDFVRWHSDFRPEWKLSPEIGVRAYQTPERIAMLAQGRDRFLVVLFAGQDDAALRQTLAATPGLLAGATLDDGGQLIVPVEAGFDDAAALAQLDEVQWIEPAPEITLRNSTNRWIVQSNQPNLTPLYDQGIRGEGQIVGVLDGKVWTAHCSFADTNPIGPTHRKILAYNTTIAADSHGTHVAGTVVGDAGVNNDTRGVAYAGKLVFDDIPSFTDAAVYAVLDQHHNQGARVHTNSWGNDGTTSYDSMARGFDRFLHDHEDSLVTLAVTNSSSLKNPENAKNLLAVGASQDTPNQGSFCSGGTGTTADGRRKPEIFAPGCSTLSSSSSSQCGTRALTGTSMATPAVAGAAMLARQYYTDGFYPTGSPSASDAFTPTGALVKATLLNSTDDMTGIAGFPSNQEGWGRVNLSNTLTFNPTQRAMYIEDIRNADGLATGEFYEVAVAVTDPSDPLRITLTWIDPPASASTGSGNAAVNDLDLIVTGPGGQTYLGNVFSGGQSSTGGSKDAKNNVEQVRFSVPAAGTYTIRIDAPAVNQGTQGFALVVAGGIEIGDLPLSIALQSADAGLVLPGTQVDVAVTVDPRDEMLVGTPRVLFAADGATFSPIDMTNAGGLIWTATLPPVLCGDTPAYYFEADGSANGTVRFPVSGERTYSVGETIVTTDEPFNAVNGWTVGPNTATVGIWELADPEPTAAQPGNAFSPALCWVTGPLAGVGVGTWDVDGGATILTSPAYDLSSAPDPQVSYMRWYSNNAGASPNLDVFTIQASNNNGASWSNAEIVGPVEQAGGGWFQGGFRVKDVFANPSSTFRVRFIAEDAGAGSVVEAAIDDFRITDIACENPPVACPADLTTTGSTNGIPDGQVNGSDFTYYLSLFAAGSPSADLTTTGSTNGTPDGQINGSDFTYYLSLFATGCP